MEFRVEGLEFRVEGLGFRVSVGSGSGPLVPICLAEGLLSLAQSLPSTSKVQLRCYRGSGGEHTTSTCYRTFS